MEIKSIQTKKIYKNIVEQIVYLIRDGSLKRGDKLPPERTLSEMLNVSRASLREALSVMEIMGIVDIRPGEGSFVSDLNVQPFITLVLPLLLKEEYIEKDLLEFRKLLEISGIKLLVENLDGNNLSINKIRRIVEQMEVSIDDVDTSARLDVEFHRSLFSLSTNSVLIKVLDYVGFILERTVKFNRNKILRKREDAILLYKQHKEIYEAVLAHDEKLAAEKMEIHLDYVNSFV